MLIFGDFLLLKGKIKYSRISFDKKEIYLKQIKSKRESTFLLGNLFSITSNCEDLLDENQWIPLVAYQPRVSAVVSSRHRELASVVLYIHNSLGRISV